MNSKQLQAVEEFCIFNENGKIHFNEFTDLTNVDLGKVVISKGFIEVYNDDEEKPKLGEKLNRPAIVTLFNQKPKQGESVDAYQNRLRKMLAKNGGEFIAYDEVKEEWIFKVPSM